MKERVIAGCAGLPVGLQFGPLVNSSTCHAKLHVSEHPISLIAKPTVVMVDGQTIHAIGRHSQQILMTFAITLQ
jgi:hypothetical protein